MRRAKRASRRITYMLRVLMVRCGETLSLFASARRVCGFAGVPATRRSGGNPPAGGFSVTVSPSRLRTARCAGPEARWILLSDAEPTGLSPGWSHSRPARESQPSGLRRSDLCSARQAAVSFCQGVSCEAAGAACSANRRAMKARQAERFLKCMRKYTVEEKTLKMKMRKKEHGRATDYLEASFLKWKRIGERQKYSFSASLFPMKYTTSH